MRSLMVISHQKRKTASRARARGECNTALFQIEVFDFREDAKIRLEVTRRWRRNPEKACPF
ncbi:MAG: hypothetical protein RLZZ224_1710 [Verrucomicrobiota bacterium]